MTGVAPFASLASEKSHCKTLSKNIFMLTSSECTFWLHQKVQKENRSCLQVCPGILQQATQPDLTRRMKFCAMTCHEMSWDIKKSCRVSPCRAAQWSGVCFCTGYDNFLPKPSKTQNQTTLQNPSRTCKHDKTPSNAWIPGSFKFRLQSSS